MEDRKTLVVLGLILTLFAGSIIFTLREQNISYKENEFQHKIEIANLKKKLERCEKNEGFASRRCFDYGNAILDIMAIPKTNEFKNSINEILVKNKIPQG